jgi:ribosomal-protein-alanine N-acetyltransferase
LPIRPASSADISTMMALASHAATAAQWTYEQYEQAIHAAQPRRIGLILEEQNAVLAFLVARAVDREWELENIAVAGLARRRGLGSRLLGEFLDLIRREQAEAVFLEVRESNLAARSLYEKWAFQQSARRPGYYAQPMEDAVVYRLAFS